MAWVDTDLYGQTVRAFVNEVGGVTVECGRIRFNITASEAFKHAPEVQEAAQQAEAMDDRREIGNVISAQAVTA